MNFLKNKYFLWFLGTLTVLIIVNAGYNKYKRYIKKKPVYDYVLDKGNVYHEIDANNLDQLKKIGITTTEFTPERLVKFDTKTYVYNFSGLPIKNKIMKEEYKVPRQSFMTVDSVIAVSDGTNQDKPWFIKGDHFFRPYEQRNNRPDIIMNKISKDGKRLTLNPSARKILKIKGTTVFFKGSQNLFHHIAESLPSIITTGLDPKKHKVAISHDQDLIIDTLKHLGFSEENIIYLHPKTSYEFEKLIIPSVLYGGNNINMDPDLTIQAIKTLKNKSKNHASLFSKSGGGYIYVSRADAARRVLNEEPLIKELKKRGFEIVIPGSLSLADQIKFFKDAKVIVAPHGAGLTNLLFANNQKALIEFFSHLYLDDGFIRISRLNRAKEYHRLIFKSSEPSLKKNRFGIAANYYVDVEKALEIIDKVIKKYS